MLLQVYTGCDVYTNIMSDVGGANATGTSRSGATRESVSQQLPDIRGEKGAMLAAIAGGAKDFEVSAVS